MPGVKENSLSGKVKVVSQDIVKNFLVLSNSDVLELMIGAYQEKDKEYILWSP